MSTRKPANVGKNGGNGGGAVKGKNGAARSTGKNGEAETESELKKKALRRTRIPAPTIEAHLLLPQQLASSSSSSVVKKEPVPHDGPEPVPSGMVDQGLPLPDRYGYDRLVAFARDPRIVFTYWELDGDRMPEIRRERGDNFVDECAWVLRVYRLNEGVAIDMEIDPSIGTWYIEVGGPGRYQAELALLSPEGEWVSILVSQVVNTPAQGPSSIIDEEWASLDPEDEEALAEYIRTILGEDLSATVERGNSEFLGSSRVAASFGVISSMIFAGGSASGRPVAGSWAWSFLGASAYLGASGSSPLGASGASGGSGGFAWMQAPTRAHEPVLERPTMFSGPNWNAQDNLPRGIASKTHLPHFKVKLPRRVVGVTPSMPPTWPPKWTSLPVASSKTATAIATSLVRKLR